MIEPFILVISGKRRVGKDTVAGVIERAPEWRVFPRRVALAAPMKETLHRWGVFTPEQLFGDAREEINPRFGKSAREVLQSFGTEWGRNLVHEDLWVEVLLTNVQDIAAGGIEVVIVTDVRFPNELRRLKEQGAYCIRVKRERPLSEGIDTHASETALDDVPDSEFDAVILNNGTLGELCTRGIEVARDAARRLEHEKVLDRADQLASEERTREVSRQTLGVAARVALVDTPGLPWREFPPDPFHKRGEIEGSSTSESRDHKRGDAK